MSISIQPFFCELSMHFYASLDASEPVVSSPAACSTAATEVGDCYRQQRCNFVSFSSAIHVTACCICPSARPETPLPARFARDHHIVQRRTVKSRTSDKPQLSAYGDAFGLWWRADVIPRARHLLFFLGHFFVVMVVNARAPVQIALFDGASAVDDAACLHLRQATAGNAVDASSVHARWTGSGEGGGGPVACADGG